MKTVTTVMALSVALGLAPAANAAIDNRNVTISEIQIWQNDSPLFLRLSNGTWCFVPNKEQAMISAVMSAYYNGNTVNTVCADRTDPFNGVQGHRLFHIQLKPLGR